MVTIPADGEYDENGDYEGPKPATALDTATERWVGGYDEEGDYTGSGEYDADLNYVGPAPTQETSGQFLETGPAVITNQEDLTESVNTMPMEIM